MYVLHENIRGSKIFDKPVVYLTKKLVMNYAPLFKFYDLNHNFLQIYIDKENKKIALQFTNLKIANSYKVPKASKIFDLVNFSKFHGIKLLPGEYDIKKTTLGNETIYEFKY